jgi:hypothetical protein
VSAARLLGKLEDLMDALPKEGLKAAKVVSLVSRLADLVTRIDESISKAECLAAVKGRQAKSGGAVLHNTGCAGIFAEMEDGVKRVWKVGSHAFTARILEDAVEIEDEEVGITIKPDEVVIKMLAGESKREEATRLTDVETIYSGYYNISYVLRKLEAHLRAIESDLAKCARETGAQC